MATTKEKAGKYIETVGRRKTSIARVRLYPGVKGGITVNEKALEEYFPTNELQTTVKAAIVLAGKDSMSVTAKIVGGGVHSQAEALRMGIARAIAKDAPELKATIKKNKLLTRDAREKERRKFGLKKARKSPQWSKR